MVQTHSASCVGRRDMIALAALVAIMDRPSMESVYCMNRKYVFHSSDLGKQQQAVR